LMTTLSFLYEFLIEHQISTNILRYIGPLAVGFIVLAAFRIGKKVVKGPINILLFIGTFVITFFYRAAWIFPTLLLVGGLIAVLQSKEEQKWNRIVVKPPYRYFIAFAVIAIGSFLLSLLWHNQLVWLFERFYRYGYLIIGGGQVVVPYMYADLVEVHAFLTSQEFLTGFGLVQGMPGPMFSFSAYAGGMASRGASILTQISGGLLSALGIFLPGVLLIYFILPIWEQLKGVKGIRISLKGITVVAAGLIASAGVLLMRDSGLTLDNFIVMILTVLLLLSKKVPAPILVALVILAGILI